MAIKFVPCIAPKDGVYVSFLNQLKFQANVLQQESSANRDELQANIRRTESAARVVWSYISELSKQLAVITPPGPALAVDNKKPWPVMKLVDFRYDARKKRIREQGLDQEVYDYVAMGWRSIPREGNPVSESVSVNFPPDLERVQNRLTIGNVKHERIEVRHPEKGTLQAFQFNYATEARGSITITMNHSKAELAFRLVGLQGFGVQTLSLPASKISNDLMDELAKLIVGQASRFG